MIKPNENKNKSLVAKDIFVKIISLYNIDIYGIEGLEDYILEKYKMKGLINEVKLFDGSIVAIIRKVTPSNARLVNENTRIHITNKRKHLLYIF